MTSSAVSSELRQRKVIAADDSFNDREVSKDELVAQMNSLITKMKAEPKPGLTNVAKKAKDELMVDPYDLMLMWNLGSAYAADNQFKQATNVLLRGWKRMSEIPDKEVRFQYLATLCECSMHEKKYRQALAVLQDIEEDGEHTKQFEILKCQVFCANGELQKGVKAFNAAIEGENFDMVGVYWTSCCTGLKKVGAWETTKSTVERYAKTEDEKKRLGAFEKIAELKESIVGDRDPGELRNQRILIAAATGIVLSALGYVLYVLEAQSLARMQTPA